MIAGGELFVPDPPSSLQDHLHDWWRSGYRAYLRGLPREFSSSWLVGLERMYPAFRVKAWQDGYDAAQRARGGNR